MHVTDANYKRTFSLRALFSTSYDARIRSASCKTDQDITEMRLKRYELLICSACFSGLGVLRPCVPSFLVQISIFLGLPQPDESESRAGLSNLK